MPSFRRGLSGNGKALMSRTIFEVGLCVVLLFCCVGSLPPGVNESHYLPKAKATWDPGYAPGPDLFLDSGNSHWVATFFAGHLARTFSLSATAWIGRLAAWTLLSVAWIHLCRSLAIPSLMRPITLLAWFLINHYGNWAGEWFAGGFEAKSIAYPLVFFGLSDVFRGRWSRAWIWVGAAVAWHPVVGGWAGITLAMLWLLESDRLLRLRHEWAGMASGLAVSLVGILPALLGLGGSDVEDGISASQVHVFYRLAHHLSPQNFSDSHHLAALIVLAAFTPLSIVVWRSSGRFQNSRSYRQLVVVAWMAVGISILGWMIDRSTSFGLRLDMAAKLLRIYWFRWSDVVVPLAMALTLAGFSRQLPTEEADRPEASNLSWRGVWIFAFHCIVGGAGIWHWVGMMQQSVPPADRWQLKSIGPFSIPSLAEYTTVKDLEEGDQLSKPNRAANRFPKRYEDWLAVCEWVKTNSPEDSLWLTPRYQQTFKWYAGRAEVVNWKDVPQDNASIIEWYRRIQHCKPPRDDEGNIRGWTTEELIQLAKKYRFQWVLIDRSFQEHPPLLECKYPILEDNRSFGVFYVPETLLD
jgi:hypothetical protein